jgi:hypothetical protein
LSTPWDFFKKGVATMLSINHVQRIEFIGVDATEELNLCMSQIVLLHYLRKADLAHEEKIA